MGVGVKTELEVIQRWCKRGGVSEMVEETREQFAPFSVYFSGDRDVGLPW